MQKVIFTYTVETVDRGTTYDEMTKAGNCFIGLKKIDGEWKEVWEGWSEAAPEPPILY